MGCCQHRADLLPESRSGSRGMEAALESAERAAVEVQLALG